SDLDAFIGFPISWVAILARSSLSLRNCSANRSNMIDLFRTSRRHSLNALLDLLTILVTCSSVMFSYLEITCPFAGLIVTTVLSIIYLLVLRGQLILICSFHFTT